MFFESEKNRFLSASKYLKQNLYKNVVLMLKIL